MNTLYAYLPCYNESGNIKALIEAWITEKDALSERGYKLQTFYIGPSRRVSSALWMETIHISPRLSII